MQDEPADEYVKATAALAANIKKKVKVAYLAEVDAFLVKKRRESFGVDSETLDAERDLVSKAAADARAEETSSAEVDEGTLDLCLDGGLSDELDNVRIPPYPSAPSLKIQC